MKEHTGSSRGELRSGRIIVAVTILNPGGSGADHGTPGHDPRGWALDGPHEVVPDGSASGLHEALRQAILRAGHLSDPEDSGGDATWPQSHWERLIEVRLRSRPHDVYADALAVMERQLLARVLDFAEGNQTRAAR